MTVYVCVITWNRRDETEHCCISLLPAIEQHDNAYLVVLDQGSTDGTAEWLTAWADGKSRVMVWTARQNAGVGGGRQRLHDFLRGHGLGPADVVIHIDSDVVAANDTWLAGFLAPLADSHIHAVAKFGCDIKPAWRDFDAHEQIIARETDVVSGGMTAYRGDVVLNCEYDRAYGGFWHEDSDLAFQIRARGGAVWTQPDIALEHNPDHACPDAQFYINWELFKTKWQGKGLVHFESARPVSKKTVTLTWTGLFGQDHAFPIINDHLTDELERLGVVVQRNEHLAADQHDLTPLGVWFEYPPKVPQIAHPKNICLSIWEFEGGPSGVPESFKRAFAQYDWIVVPNRFVAAQYQGATMTAIKVVPFIGVDPVEFSPQGPPANWATLFPGEDWVNEASRVFLWVGGTDPRHGYDVLLDVADYLHPEWHIVAKLSAHYPPDARRHPRVHVLDQPMDSLAPLYRAADMFILTARAVGLSMPVLEALAVGCPVIAPDLPAIREYSNGQVWRVDTPDLEGPILHHIHADCQPYWRKVSAGVLAEEIARYDAALTMRGQRRNEPYIPYTWANCARMLWDAIGEGL